jgi:hypothetical protein
MMGNISRSAIQNALQSRKVAISVTTVGLIRSGHVGSTVARLAIGAGHDVVLSNSRGPGTLRDLTSELGPHARAATHQEAPAAGEIVLVSIPVKAYANDMSEALLQELPGKLLPNEHGDRHPRHAEKGPTRMSCQLITHCRQAAGTHG